MQTSGVWPKFFDYISAKVHQLDVAFDDLLDTWPYDLHHYFLFGGANNDGCSMNLSERGGCERNGIE